MCKELVKKHSNQVECLTILLQKFTLDQGFGNQKGSFGAAKTQYDAVSPPTLLQDHEQLTKELDDFTQYFND